MAENSPNMATEKNLEIPEAEQTLISVTQRNLGQGTHHDQTPEN